MGSLKFPLRWSVSVSRWSWGEKDKYGNREKVFGPFVDRKVYGWAPPGVEEEMYSANRDYIIQDLDVYAPRGFDIGPDDRMVIAGETFRVLGGSRDFNHGPFGFTPGDVIRVKRVEVLG